MSLVQASRLDEKFVPASVLHFYAGRTSHATARLRTRTMVRRIAGLVVCRAADAEMT